ncbi:MAG: type I restriction endonuclease [Acidobacteriota bacterium]|nr:type I restriction endonuclease [Acidobacteriota bacterium]
MSLYESLKTLSGRIQAQKDGIQTEEATKTAFVLPFIAALGYNVFDPTEVTPELTADMGIKKGEKVDYAILQDGQPVILIECKDCRADLDRAHASQLYRYFHCTSARVGVLTNGITWRFFSDLEEKNKMDEKPFLVVDMLNLREPVIKELQRLQKGSLDVDEIVTAAGDLKYTREIRKVFSQNVADPSEEFARFFAGEVYSGRLTQKVLEQFREYTRRAISQYLSDRISDRLQYALDQEKASTTAESRPQEATAQEAETEIPAEEDGVETTAEESAAFHIVTAICSEVVEPDRVVMRDVKSYCGILLDDNNRKPICRLHFNTSQKYLGVFTADKDEERIPIGSIREIYSHRDRLKATVQGYLDQEQE